MSRATSFLVIFIVGSSLGCFIFRPKQCSRPQPQPQPQPKPEPKPQPQCRPTCANPNPYNCGPNDCPRGYIRTCAQGACIRICDCSTSEGCNGDPNAMIKEYPPPCGPTCENPRPCECNRPQKELGCVCKPNYMFSEREQRCVAQCPAGCAV